MNTNSFIELDALQEEIKTRIGLLECWVKVEVESHREVNGHHYLNVLQKNENGSIAAKASAKIWKYNARIISNFKQSTGKDIVPGISIVVYAKVDYHAQYGLSLIIVDIDNAYSLGQREMEKRQTIQRLTESGAMQLQKQLALPYLPSNIAIISSPSAAGYGDFVKHLNTNTKGYVYNYTLFEVLVQGDYAPATIIQQLVAIQEAACYDMVLLMRGGGAESDMFCFDNFELCSAIASCPIPVLTAIGHDRDYHVADMVAHGFFKTPTALADFLVDWTTSIEETMTRAFNAVQQALSERLMKEENKLVELFSNIRYYISNGVNGFERVVHRIQMSIAGNISQRLLVADKEVDRTLSNIVYAITSKLDACNNQVMLLESKINSSDPRGILQQGYVLATADDGSILKNVYSKAAGDSFSVLFTDGSWKSTIQEVKPKNNNPK